MLQLGLAASTLLALLNCGAAQTRIGVGECADPAGARVDHCCDYGGSIWINNIATCRQICAGMQTCRAFEFGRRSHYSCCVYPEDGNMNFRSDSLRGQLVGSRTWYCYGSGSNGPVARANNHGHQGVCYRLTSPTTPAPTSTAPTSPSPTEEPSPAPTAMPISSAPTAEPTAGPTRHACNDGSHQCDTTAFGICEQVDDGAGTRCSCASTHQCSDGTCTTPSHTCLLITPDPTAAPTTTPTASPTNSPTRPPTVAPTTTIPTAAPTSAPSTLYDYDIDGNPIFPLDAGGNEVLATDDSGRAVVPLLNGVRVYPSTTTTASTVESTAVMGGGMGNPAGSSASGADGGGGSAVGIVVAVTAVLVVLVVAGAFLYVKTVTAKGIPAKAFANPMYEATLGAPTATTAANLSGYMDVPAPNAGATGYMDVASGFGGDDDAEDV